MRSLNKGGRIVVALTLAVFLVVLAAGCSKSSGNSGTAAGKADEVKGTVTVWGWDDNWKKIFDVYSEKVNPNIKVDYVPVNDYAKKFVTALASGTDIPDMGWMEMGSRGKFVAMDVWEKLEDSPYSVNKSDMLPFLVPLCTNPEGKIVGIECGPSPSGLAYRRDLAKQYFGTDDPAQLEKIFTSWDVFIEKGVQVKQKSGGSVYMFASIGDAVQVLGYQNTTPFVENNSLKIKDTLLGPFKTVQAMRDKGIVDKLDQWSPAWNASFSSAKYIFYPCASWSPMYMIEPNDKDGKGHWGLMLPPGGAFNWGGTIFGIPKAAKNKAASWKVLQWSVWSVDGAKYQRDMHGSMSAYKPVYQDASFYAKPDEYFAGQPLLQIFSGLAEKTQVRPLNKYDDVVSDAISLGIKGLTTGASASDAVKAIEAEITRKIPDLKAK
jgi:multiple sugar transport system substrate-binding protein